MKVQIYLYTFTIHLFLLLLYTPVNSEETTTRLSDEEIYKGLKVEKKLCGSVLADTMRDLCQEYNGPRARRSITQCCRKGCSYEYLMFYFCKVPRIKVDELDRQYGPTTESGDVYQNYKNDLSRQVSSSTIPTLYGQQKAKKCWGKHLGKHKKHKHHSKCCCVLRTCKEPFPNKINRQPTSEELNHKPAEYGYVHSTRPPIIYSHSNYETRGAMEYKVPHTGS